MITIHQDPTVRGIIVGDLVKRGNKLRHFNFIEVKIIFYLSRKIYINTVTLYKGSFTSESKKQIIDTHIRINTVLLFYKFYTGKLFLHFQNSQQNQNSGQSRNK